MQEVSDKTWVVEKKDHYSSPVGTGLWRQQLGRDGEERTDLRHTLGAEIRIDGGLGMCVGGK